MRDLGIEKSVTFRKQLVGRPLEVLILGRSSCGASTGLSGNYVRTFFKRSLSPNTMVRARVNEITGTGVFASLEEDGTKLNT